MALNSEYLRLNLYKKPADAVRDLDVQSEPFAYDLHYNVFTKGEVTDYEAINVSITNILLTTFGELLFELGIGSSLSAVLFNQITSVDRGEELLTAIIEEVEAIETRINIVSEQARLKIKPDNNSLEIELPYEIKKTGLKSLFTKRINI